ncbi:MAG TPA: HD domain-containing protein [Acetobacteraceae bacterium]|nr:HD domain-containing protein [Acetobacteraceae bacterium]
MVWSRLAAAAAYTMEIHAHQIRKGANTPYIGHLLQVAGLVLEHGGDEDQAIAGMLHDAIEDVGVEQEAVIAERFGPRVARIVRACTDADTFPKPPWRARKEAYIAHLEQCDQEVLFVSAADKLHNARSIVTDLRALGPAMFDRFTAPKEGTLWYYASLSEVFRRLLPGALAEELTETVTTMQRLATQPKGNKAA